MTFASLARLIVCPWRTMCGRTIRNILPPGFPTIVALCGSTRFHEEFVRQNYLETMVGNIVLSVGFYPHSSEKVHGESLGCEPEQKKRLDELHMDKILIADEVIILNVGGYIGESTRRELEYAMAIGKRVRFLEDPDKVKVKP